MQNLNQTWINKFYNKLTSPQTIRFCGYSVMGLYIGLVCIAYIVAFLFGSESYSIFNNYISDLGSIRFTPFPIIYDLACVFAGILTIPFIFYLERYIAPIPQSQDELPAPHRWTYRLVGLNFFFNMLGSIFYVGVGIFSEDRDYFGMHGICSYVTFGGFAFAALFLGITLLFTKQNIVPKPFNCIIGSIGIVLPITIAILNLIYGGPLLEWLLLFAILIWTIPLFLYSLNHAHKLISKSK